MRQIRPRALPTVYFFWRNSPPVGQGLLIHEVSRSHTKRRTTVGSNPLDEGSAHRRDLYLTTHNTHNRQTFMPSVGFEPTLSTGERPQICALDRAATGTGTIFFTTNYSLLINLTLIRCSYQQRSKVNQKQMNSC